MKVLYCNPIALDYRIPFYKRLNELLEGSFFFLYSETRYKLTGREDLMKKLVEVLDENAIPYKGERIFNTYTKSFTRYSSERGQRIPFTFGLFGKIRKERPDVLITEGFFQWTPLIILYSIIFHTPVFIGYERTPWTERNVKWWQTLQRKITNKFVRGYLVNGSETKKYLMSIGVKEERIHIGGMSADSEGLRQGIASMTTEEKTSLRKRFINEPGLVFLFSGRVSVLKGADLLLSAWEKHVLKYPHDHIILIGHGDLSNMMEQKYKDFPSVHLMGKVDYNEVHKYYAISDVFILPTLTDNWSLVIPEAMSCGLPVTTSIYNGCHPELVHEGENGCTFDTFDQESILKALDYFHYVDLKEHGRKSIELEKEFNTENSARREYEGIMKGLGVK